MKTIITVIVITFAVITTANADAEAHLFKAEELEVQAEVLETEAGQHEAQAEKLIQEADVIRRKIIKEREDRLAAGEFPAIMQKQINKWRNRLGKDDEKSARHKSKAEKLHNEANRLRARAAIHRRRAEGN